MKRLTILAAGLIALGLLFTGSANAMTYTVNGSGTSIAIPKNTSEGININWGDGLTGTVSDCSDTILLGTTFKQCQHNYAESNTYDVSVSNTNNEMVVNMYLNEANITHIDDFNGFPDLNTIYLQHNNISQIGSNAFAGLSNSVVYLDYNNIYSFNSSLANIKYLYLTYNSFTAIPDSIRNYNDSARFIRLSSTVGTGRSGGKFIDLSNNPIKFVKIIKIDGYDSSSYTTSYIFQNTTNYQFERFGYAHDANPTTYDYQILHNNSVVENTYGTTSDTEVSIDTPLNPGDYTFKVCIHNDDTECDTIDFSVYYSINIYMTGNPDDGHTTSSLDGIYFTWQKQGYYPESLISGYVYSLIKTGIVIDSGSSSNDPASYTLSRSLIEGNPNGNYAFLVELLDIEGNPITSYETEFTIEVNNAINVLSPINTQEGNRTNGVNVNFKWNTSSTLFGRYDYYVTDSDTCSGSAHVITGGTSDTPQTTFNHLLGIGDYLLCIDMYNTSNIKISNKSQSFSVDIPIIIEITSPGSTVATQPIEFSWDSFIPSPYGFTSYTYVINRGSEEISSGTFTNINDKSFTLSDLLRDDTYTVSVTLNYSDGSITYTLTDTQTFTVNSSAGIYLNITPTHGGTFTGNHVNQVPVTLSWQGGGSPLISKYYYELTNTSTSQVIYSGTKLESESQTIGTKSLPSGTYRFEVTMLDNDNDELRSNYSDFTVVIPLDLKILSPSAGELTVKDVTFSRSGFAELTHHYSYQLNKIDGAGNETPIASDGNTTSTSFTRHLLNGEYTFTVSIIDVNNESLTRSVTFIVPDEQGLTINISNGQSSVTTLNSRTGIFSWGGTSENFDSYSYSVVGTTFKNESYSYTGTSRATAGNFTLNDLSTGRYRFTVTMLDSSNNPITGRYIDFNVVIPATLKITSPVNGATITSSNITFTRTGYNDTTPRYEYKLTGQPASYTESTSFTTNLVNGNYTLTVKLYSGDTYVAQDSIDFTVNTSTKPTNGGGSGGGGGGGGSSGKTHYNNNLKLSVGNSSPTTNERIKLIVNIDDKYTGKVSFPKLQYYSPDTQKWVDIPPTSKNYISEYGDEAKLGYVKFTSNDDGEKELSQFVKFSKSGYYRIYAEDKDGYDADVEIYVSTKKATTTSSTNTTPTTTNNNTNVNSIIREFLPEVFEQTDIQEEVYIARSCKRYTITYSDSLKVYTSPNLNTNEYFVSKEYFKRYIDSKNKYQSGCPTNVGWISTNYSDKSNDNTRYTAPNGKVYFITSQNGKYYSNELNKELKTPTSFNSVQELKYYIRDRNPLISMAALGPTK